MKTSQLLHLCTNAVRRVVPLPHSASNGHLIAAIREAWRPLKDQSPSELLASCSRVRTMVAQQGVDAPPVRIQSFAIFAEALRRARAVELYDVQLIAALVLAGGGIAEMQTGEGKTFACAPAAFLHALAGKGVHIATPNCYLAQRDYELVSPAFAQLGMRVGLLSEQTSSAKRLAYRCDATYGTGHEFGFDYLRDQLALRESNGMPLGMALLEHLAGGSHGHATRSSPAQRGLYYTIVDEADQELLDDAVSPLILCSSSETTAVDGEVHREAKQLAMDLVPGIDFEFDASGNVRLKTHGVDKIHGVTIKVPINKLRRTWTEYVEQSLRAAFLRRNVHYIVDEEGKVQIVDTNTGRILTDRSWRDGLHQAVEAREGLTITSDKQALAQITRQRFSRLYERLAGLTGTATGGQSEFRQIYDVPTHPIPLRTASQRTQWPSRFFINQLLKWNALTESVLHLHTQGRPVLVGTRCIADSERLAGLFRDRGIVCQLLNGLQDSGEAVVVAAAGQCGAVTIATNLAGRGTDIKLGDRVAGLGGLHVIVGECGDSARIDRQLIGRCARQGDPGSAQMFISAEDSLIAQHGAWLAKSMGRLANTTGEIAVDLMPQILRIQRSAERKARAARAALLRLDIARDSLWSGELANS